MRFAGKRIRSLSFSLGGFISGLAVLLIFTSKTAPQMPPPYTLLCLGDSYTIGESVLPGDNFPNQTIQLLRQSNYAFEAPEIVAQTGWTTDELQTAINHHSFKASYDFVTLLIGVNNQYRKRTIEDYKPGFESLLRQAIQLGGGKANHVVVLSIPDWGVTPYAKDRDKRQVAKEIDDYNEANKIIAETYKVNYIDITPGTREAMNDLRLVASDGLHPSAKEYAKWAEKIYLIIQQLLP